jgi:hypothetical protein
MFSALFSYTTQPSHFCPEAPILGLAVVIGFGAIAACTLIVPAAPACNSFSDEHKDNLLRHDNTSTRGSSIRSSFERGPDAILCDTVPH